MFYANTAEMLVNYRKRLRLCRRRKHRQDKEEIRRIMRVLRKNLREGVYCNPLPLY